MKRILFFVMMAVLLVGCTQKVSFTEACRDSTCGLWRV